MRPIVVVHGIWDNERSVGPLVHGLARHGHRDVVALSLRPPWGMAPIEELAAQLGSFIAELQRRLGCEAVDVVGFSMGALVTRTYLQLLGGDAHVRTFISISGPQRGTLTAYALPLYGVRQMRPGSPLLRALGTDVSHLHRVAVHCVYTPFDALIVPSESSVLDGARSVHKVPVLVHRLMLSDARVHALAAKLLHDETHSSREIA
jgi:triacylglycerol esterase/lipase EstA (alpha/beta hydrolase family)